MSFLAAVAVLVFLVLVVLAIVIDARHEAEQDRIYARRMESADEFAERSGPRV